MSKKNKEEIFMKNEEENILKRLEGTSNQFKVPEGYFENFTVDLMSKLPNKEKKELIVRPSKWTMIKPYFYMAAMFIGAALIIKAVSFNMSETTEKTNDAVVEREQAQDQIIDAALDGAMIDDYSLYVYLNESN